jgi:purine-binding chemotaxis protein CheW
MQVRRRYVSFILDQGRYCIAVDEVLQILRRENLMEVPRAPSFVEGVINLRGDVVPVVSLRERFGMGKAAGLRKPRIIVAQAAGRLYGLAVDEVREIVEIDDAAVREDGAGSVGAGSAFVRGMAERGGDLHMIVDLAGVLGASG